MSEIIQHTSQTVRSGEEVSLQAVAAFNSIAKGVSEISGKLIQINDASREQELGVRQTSAALTQMNEATASNSAVARENATLGVSLRTQVERLVSVGRAVNYVVMGSENTRGDDVVDQKRMSRIDRILSHSDGQSGKLISIESAREGLGVESKSSDDIKRELAASILNKSISGRELLESEVEQGSSGRGFSRRDHDKLAS